MKIYHRNCIYCRRLMRFEKNLVKQKSIDKWCYCNHNRGDKHEKNDENVTNVENVTKNGEEITK